MSRGYFVSYIVRSRGQAIPTTTHVPVDREFHDDAERGRLVESLTSDVRTALGNPAATVEILSLAYDPGAA
jgi:hypothetical protein